MKPMSIIVSRVTPLNQKGKRGLMIMHTACCSSAWKPGANNQIRNLNLLLGNALFGARAHIAGHAIFVVIRDVFCNYCILCKQLAVRMVTRPLLPFWLRGVARETMSIACIGSFPGSLIFSMHWKRGYNVYTSQKLIATSMMSCDNKPK